MLYRPLSLVVSVLGGILAGAVFTKVWAVDSGEEEAPESTSPEYSTKEVLVAVAVQGAIFAVVNAVVDPGRRQGHQEDHRHRSREVGGGCLSATRRRCPAALPRLTPCLGCDHGRSGRRRRFAVPSSLPGTFGRKGPMLA